MNDGIMSERIRSATDVGNPAAAYTNHNTAKMATDLTPKKTLMILVIVVGCFAVLWPKVFYPMLLGSAQQQMKPSAIDKRTGCCDVISETDVHTIKILSELCKSIIEKHSGGKQPSPKEIVTACRSEVLKTCGIDISAVLQEQINLGRNVKQILNDVRSLNGSLCLKYNYGVSPSRLGVAHRITLNIASDSRIRQERPPLIKQEMLHPAFRERGRAIPQPQAAPAPSRPPPRVVEGRPGPLPGLRPTIGGAGHVVPPSKQGSSMSVIMPIYTIGIVVFFSYTLVKIIFKKQPEGVGGSLYPPIDPDPHFRREVFESDKSQLASRLARDGVASKLVVNAMSALLDEVDQELEARRRAKELSAQDEHLANGKLSNGSAVNVHDEDRPSVTVMGMEMTASCEGGQRWTAADSPVLPHHAPTVEPVTPPQEIYLEGTLPAQSQLLVSDSATEAEPHVGEDPAVVLAGKMTLSVINVDNAENEDEIEITNQVEATPISSEENKNQEKETTKQENNANNDTNQDSEERIEDFIIKEQINEDITEFKIKDNADLSNRTEDLCVKKETELVTCSPLDALAKDSTVEQISEKIETASEDKQEIKTSITDSAIETGIDIDKEISELLQKEEIRQTESQIPVKTTIGEEPKLELEKEIDALIAEAKDTVLSDIAYELRDIPSGEEQAADEFDILRRSKEKDIDKLLHEHNDPIEVTVDSKIPPSDEELLQDITSSIEFRNGDSKKNINVVESEEHLDLDEKYQEDPVIDLIDERSETNTLQEVSNIEDESVRPEDNKYIMEQVLQDKINSVEDIGEDQKTDEDVLVSEEEIEYEDEEVEEVEEDEEEEEIEDELEVERRVRDFPNNEPSGKFNGNDLADDSKYTNITSSAAVAEQNISEGDKTDEEIEEDDEEVEEVEEIVYEDDEEEEEEVDDEPVDDVPNEKRDVNHITNSNTDNE